MTCSLATSIRQKSVVIQCHHGPITSIGNERIKEGRLSLNTLCSLKSHLQDLRRCCAPLNPHPQEGSLYTSPRVWDHPGGYEHLPQDRETLKVWIIPDIVMNWEYKEQNMNEKLSSPKILRIFILTKESDFLGKDPTLDRLQTVECVSKLGI